MELKNKPNSFLDDFTHILFLIIAGISGYQMFTAESSLSPEFLRGFIFLIVIWIFIIQKDSLDLEDKINKLKEEINGRRKKGRS